MQGICTELRGFQSTPPRGRRLWRLMDSIGILNFNPRLREGGDRFPLNDSHGVENFNPRLREGGDGIWDIIDKYAAISIHASAREATKMIGAYLRSSDISIHASAREATTGQTTLQTILLFQSTPPRGRRRGLGASPHDLIDFNPRLREGGD